jgi:hypothetical protein
MYTGEYVLGPCCVGGVGATPWVQGLRAVSGTAVTVGSWKRWKRAACDRAGLRGSQRQNAWASGGPGVAVSSRCAESGMRGRLGWCDVCHCGSFRDVAQVAVWGLRLMLHREQVDSGNAPDNAYSQGVQELNASAGTC